MVEFNSFKFEAKNNVLTCNLFDQEIEVLQYLPISDKKDLIQIAMQKSFEDGLYNNILLDVYFHLNIIYLYTNIHFSEEDKSDELALFDKLKEVGLIDLILSSIPEEEYQYLFENLERSIDQAMKYKNSAAAVIQSIVQDLPANAAAAAEIVNNWDPQKFQSVQDMVQLARETGMNPPVPIQEEAAPAENVVSFLEEQAKMEQQPQE